MPIAIRKLHLRTNERTIEIPVRIFAPERDRSGNWSCKYEIDWPDRRRSMEAGGYDSIQALVSALTMIGADIYTSSYHKAGQLYFDKPGNGYGFPVVATLRHLLIGDDAKYL